MNTRVCIVGESWGKHEAEAKRPFVGPSGELLNRLLEEAGFFTPGTASAVNKALWQRNFPYRDAAYAAEGIFLTNVFNLQPPGNDIEALCGPRWEERPPIRAGKYIAREYIHHLGRLDGELRQHQPNLVLGMGATALWFLVGPAQIRKQRGAVAVSPYGKCLCTWHPAYLMRGAWDQRPIVIADLMKAHREAEYPEIRRPQRFVHIPETINDIKYIYPRLIDAKRLSVDIETANDRITCIGFAWSATESLVIPWTDTMRPGGLYWSDEDGPQAWRWIKRICGLPMPKVFQNGLYDLHFLWRRYGITVANCQDDTMLLHHALQPELQKGLGFLGSIYTNEPAWKLMRSRGKEATLKDLREE